MTTGECAEIQGDPRPEWNRDFETVREIYYKTVSLSGYDMNGYPQLTKLEFVLGFIDCEISSKNVFLEYLTAIHNAECQMRISELRK